MDEIDIAQEREQGLREAALAASRSRPPVEETEDCRVCGEQIPEARRLAVRCDTCVACQQEIERRK